MFGAWEDEEPQVTIYFKTAAEIDPHMSKIDRGVWSKNKNEFKQARELYLAPGTWIVETRFKHYFPHWEGMNH